MKLYGDLGLIGLIVLIIYGLYLMYRRSKLCIEKNYMIHRARKAFCRADRKTLTVQDNMVDRQESCCICMETFGSGDDVITLPCSHNYHYDCIKKWLFEKRTCPLCKHDALMSLGLVLSPNEEWLWEAYIITRDPNGRNISIV